MAFANAEVEISADFQRFSETQFPQGLRRAVARAAAPTVRAFRSLGEAAGRAMARAIEDSLERLGTSMGRAGQNMGRLFAAGFERAVAALDADVDIGGLIRDGDLAGRLFAAAAERHTKSIEVDFDRGVFSRLTAFAARSFERLGELAAEVGTAIAATLTRIGRGFAQVGTAAVAGIGTALSQLPAILAEVAATGGAAAAALAAMIPVGVLLVPVFAALAVVLGAVGASIITVTKALALAAVPALLGAAGAVGVLVAGFFQLRDAMDLGSSIKGAQARLDELVRTQGRNSAAAKAARAELARLRTEFNALPAPLRDMVPAIDAVRSAFSRLADRLSGPLFDTVGVALKEAVDNLLPAVEPGLQRLAVAFNILMLNIVNSFRSPELQAGFNELFAGLGRVIQRFADQAIPRLSTAFGKLSVAATPFLERMGNAVTGLAVAFADWVDEAEKSGKLNRLFQQAGDALGKLGAIVGNLIGAFAGLFKPAAEDSESFLDSLVDLTAELKNLVLSEDFQTALTTFTDDVGDLVKDLPKLIEGINNVVNAFQLLSGTLDTTKEIFKGIAAAVPFLSPPVAILQNWESIQAFFSGIGDAISAGLTAAGEGIAAFARGVGEKAAEIAGFFASLPGKILDFLIALPGQLTTFFGTVFTLAVQAVSTGIGFIIGFFISLPVRIIDAVVSLSTTLAEFFTNLWTTISTAAATAWDGIVAFVTGLPARITAGVETLKTALPKFFADLWTSAKTKTTEGINAIVAAITGLPGKIRDLGSSLLSAGKDAIGKLIDGLLDFGGKTAQFASKIGKAIKNWINDNVIDRINSGIKAGSGGIIRTNLIPRLLARGAFLKDPTVALVAERGPEVVIPLNNPARARQLVDESGLGNIVNLQRQSVTNVRVFIGQRELTDIVRVETNQAIAGQGEALAQGPRFVGA